MKAGPKNLLQADRQEASGVGNRWLKLGRTEFHQVTETACWDLQLPLRFRVGIQHQNRPEETGIGRGGADTGDKAITELVITLQTAWEIPLHRHGFTRKIHLKHLTLAAPSEITDHPDRRCGA